MAPGGPGAVESRASWGRGSGAGSHKPGPVRESREKGQKSKGTRCPQRVCKWTALQHLGLQLGAIWSRERSGDGDRSAELLEQHPGGPVEASGAAPYPPEQDEGRLPRDPGRLTERLQHMRN